MSGIVGLILDDFELYKRPYRGAPGGAGGAPASAGPVLTSLLAIPTDTVGNSPGNRRGIAAAKRGVPYPPYGGEGGKRVKEEPSPRATFSISGPSAPHPFKIPCQPPLGIQSPFSAAGGAGEGCRRPSQHSPPVPTVPRGYPAGCPEIRRPPFLWGLEGLVTPNMPPGVQNGPPTAKNGVI